MSLESIVQNKRKATVPKLKNFFVRNLKIAYFAAMPFIALNTLSCENNTPGSYNQDAAVADSSPVNIFDASMPDKYDISPDLYADMTVVRSCDDKDGDGYGDEKSLYGIINGCQFDLPDCDDLDHTVHPYATEFCDEQDNDCDGNIDEEVQLTFYRDQDKDGFGNPNDAITTCLPQTGYVDNAADCDDTHESINPMAEELCDGLDNNCNQLTDDSLILPSQICSAGLGECKASGLEYKTCEGNNGWSKSYSNCDALPKKPQTEICDSLDNDCDGVIDNENICGRRCSVDDLVAHWKFDEDAGAVANDSSGHGYSGTINGPVSVPGKIVNAFQYDGIDDTVTVPNNNGLDLSGELTLMAWTYREKAPAGGRVICKRDDVSGNGYALEVSNNKFWVHLRNNDSFSSTVDLPLNEWAHIAATFNRGLGIARIYINGKHDSEHYTAQSVAPSRVDFQIGRQGNSASGFFQGKIDEPKIYSCALWPDQIKAEYDQK